MAATMVHESADSLTIQVVIRFNRSMLEAEEETCDALNQGGKLSQQQFSQAIRHGSLSDHSW